MDGDVVSTASSVSFTCCCDHATGFAANEGELETNPSSSTGTRGLLMDV